MEQLESPNREVDHDNSDRRAMDAPMNSLVDDGLKTEQNAVYSKWKHNKHLGGNREARRLTSMMLSVRHTKNLYISAIIF